jgi:MerR family transcriptional regulator, light-induced transcriptional regulator
MNARPSLPAASDYPLYNIGVVTRMTGISIATLRAWERRYGFPQSSRTGGGHRLYTENDIARLRWVKAHIDQGMQTAQAIQALQYQDLSGRHVEEREALPPEQPDSAPYLQTVRDRLQGALTHHDTEKADLILSEALPLVHPEGLILDVIGPVLDAIGEAWVRNEVGVATEHLATGYLRHRLLMWMASGPPPLPMQPLILACAPGEWHEGGLLMLGALLRRRRWPVAYLGQAVPLPDLADLARDVLPPLIVLVATAEQAAAALVDWPLYLPEAAQSGRPVICFAGRYFVEHSEWRLRVPGQYLGDTIRDGMDTIERLLQ